MVSSLHNFGLPAFGDSLTRGSASSALRHAESYAVQPRAEGFRLPDGSGLPRQYEEDSLCRVFCLMPTAKNVATHAVNDRPMSLDKSGESGLG
jgi:hypothetical protein